MTGTARVDDAELKRHLVTMLTATWRRVDWKVMKRKDRSRADTFSTRLYDASHEGSLDEAINTICERLGVDTPGSPRDTDEYFKAYEYCMKHEDTVLDMLETRYKLLAYMTSKRAYGNNDTGTTGEAEP